MEQRWMWLPGWTRQDEQEPRLVYFRGTLQLPAVPDQLPVRITADSRYKLFVNGQFAEAGPRKGNQDVWYLDAVDIAPYLRAGENILAVQVLRYPYEHWKGNHGIFRTETPGLYVFLECPVQWKCRAAEGFHIVPESIYFSPLMILERVSGDQNTAGWMLPGFSDELWQEPVYAAAEAVPPVRRVENLVPRRIPSLYRKPGRFLGTSKGERRTDWNALLQAGTPLEIPPHTVLSADLDAGLLTTGYPHLRLAGGAGAEITLLQAECYAGDPAPNPENPYKALPLKGDRTDASLDLHGFTDVYRPAGYGRIDCPETYEPFWFRTFRYLRVTIETGDQPITVLGLDYTETGYPLEVRAKVKTSDPTLQPIWDISERSLRRCMHETYEDCPFYEQLQYAMDGRSEILYTYASSGDDRLAVQCMEDFTHALRPDGMINCSFPNFETNVIPGFGIYFIGMVWDHMMYFGDRAQAQSCWHTVERILSFFRERLDPRGLVGKIGDVNHGGIWSFIDWTVAWKHTDGVPPATKQGPITMESLLYILGLGYAADLADFLDLPEQARRYRQEADGVRAAVNQYCIGPHGLYQDGPGIEEYTQHSQVFAVLTDTTDPETGRSLLLETLRDPHRYAPCSVAMCWYLFRALEKTGLYRETHRLWDIWRDMVSDHLTTCGEDPVTCRSDCHGWGALALYELPAAILGVRPGKPGFAEILVDPQTDTLDWASGTVPTPRGPVSVSWKKNESGEISLQVQGPEGCAVRTGNRGNTRLENNTENRRENI